MIAKLSKTPSRICVGIVSRDRRQMVENLLKSLTKLRQADYFTIEIVLVENGPKVVLRELAADFTSRMPDIPLHYIHEPNIGVVYARNVALDFATTGGFDKLAFVDDDEIVDPEWLLNLHRAQSKQKLDLIGGPVRPFMRARPNSRVQHILWKNYQSRARRVERVSNIRNIKGRAGNIMLATNNWMFDLTQVKFRNLRFDVRYNLSGGEDTAFFYELKKIGGTSGWAKNAIVKEEVPLARLSARYQFTRSRDQSLVSFYRKYERRPIKKWLTIPFEVVYKMLAAIVLLVLVPFTLGNTFLSAIRAFGAAIGRLAGLMGKKTQHYAQTTGH